MLIEGESMSSGCTEVTWESRYFLLNFAVKPKLLSNKRLFKKKKKKTMHATSLARFLLHLFSSSITALAPQNPPSPSSRRQTFHTQKLVFKGNLGWEINLEELEPGQATFFGFSQIYPLLPLCFTCPPNSHAEKQTHSHSTRTSLILWTAVSDVRQLTPCL